MRGFWVVVMVSLFLISCDKTTMRANQASQHSKFATEQIIFQAMGSGLMGQALTTLPLQDQRAAMEAEYRALEYAGLGQKTTWQSPDGTQSGTVTPGQPYRVGTQDCRQYRHEFTINNIPQTARGSACRNEDGSWSPLG